MNCEFQEYSKAISGKNVGSPKCKCFGCECQYAENSDACPFKLAMCESEAGA